jgi:hypothetical protein
MISSVSFSGLLFLDIGLFYNHLAHCAMKGCKGDVMIKKSLGVIRFSPT